MVNPQFPHDTVIHEGTAAIGRLDSLSLSMKIIQDTLDVAKAEHARVTRLHPKSAAGYYLWSEGVSALRQRLVLQRPAWTPDDERGYPVIIHPSQSHRIAVSGGNENTGIAAKNPSTRNPKGRASRDAVDTNQSNFWQIIPNFGGEPTRGAVATAIDTWVLLIHVDSEGELVRAELSLPSGYDRDGYVNRWAERIIIDAVPYARFTIEFSDEDDGDDEQGVIVERRSA